MYSKAEGGGKRCRKDPSQNWEIVSEAEQIREENPIKLMNGATVCAVKKSSAITEQTLIAPNSLHRRPHFLERNDCWSGGEKNTRIKKGTAVKVN